MATLKDIARDMGCSVSLVSRALNNHPTVKESTREQIIATAKRKNYYPDRAARSLIGHPTGVIGVLMASNSGIYYSTIVNGIEYVASETDYSLVFSNSFNLCEYEKFMDRVDGLIIFSSYIKKSRIPEIMDRDIPMVFVESNLTGDKTNCIYVDNKLGGYIATKHLVELKHTRIAHIAGDLSDQVSMDRMKGYQNALQEAGLPFQTELIRVGNFDSDGGYRAMKSLLESGPLCTAVFIASDEMSFGALHAIHEAGLQVPGEISVIGYDDVEFSRYTHPPLTTVRQPRFELGKKSMSFLVSILKCSVNNTESVKICYTPELVVRGTTGSPGCSREHAFIVENGIEVCLSQT